MSPDVTEPAATSEKEPAMTDQISYGRTLHRTRLEEAERLRLGHHLALARRKSRRAERAALQARLVLARTL